MNDKNTNASPNLATTLALAFIAMNFAAFVIADIIGIFFLLQSQKHAYPQVIQHCIVSAIVLLAMSVLAGWIGILLARRLAAPIVNLTQCANRITGGELDVIAAISGPSEMRHLSAAFKHMTQKFSTLINKEAQKTHALEREISQRKKTNKALEESEAILKATLESTEDGVLVVDGNGYISHYNNRFVKIWSISDALLATRSDKMLINHVLPQIDGAKQFTEKIEQLYQSLHESRDILNLKDGRILERFSYPLTQRHHENGRVWFFRDITERKHAEEMLKKNERRLRDLTANVPGVVVQFRSTRDHVYSNEFLSAKTTEIFGLEPNSKTILDEFYTHIPNEEQEAYATSMRNAIDTLSPWSYEGRFIRPDGETIWFSGHAIPHDEGDTIVYYGILLDITQRKKMEYSLRLSQFIFDKADIAILILDENGKLININEAVSRYFGYSREELLKMTVFDIDTEFTPKIWTEHMTDLRNRSVKTIETLNRRKDGTMFPVQVIDNIMTFEDQEFHVTFIQDITERKQMEEALNESEQRLDLALSGANEGIWDWRVQESIVYVDDRYYTVAGYRPREFPSTLDEISKRIHPDDIERLTSANSRYLAGTLDTFEEEYRFEHKNGSYMWIQVKGKIVAWDKDGNPTRFCGTHADITGRKMTEEALRENERLLNNILESINDGIMVLDTDFKCTIWNDAMARMVNASKEQTIGKVLWEVFPFLNNTPVVKNITNTMQGISGGNLEIQLPLPSGEMVWFRDNFSPLINADGRLIGVVGVVSDISQRKQDEENLHRLRNYLSNIIDSMPSILIAVDRDGKVTQWNNHTARVTGINSDTARSQPLTKVFPRLAEEMEQIQSAIRERRVISSSKVLHKVAQEARFEDITIFPLATNGVDGAVIRVDDVTEQVRMEEMMIQSEKMLSVGGLAAGMAHEINNPLAGMMQTAEVMANRLVTNLHIPANHKAAEAAGTTVEAIGQFMTARGIPRMLSAINESGKRVAAIVENMLSFARKGETVFSSHDIGNLLDKTVALASTDYDLKKKYDFRQIPIEKVYADPPVYALCEDAKIQQVLLNILRNGAQAMQEAGTESPRFILRTRKKLDPSMAVIEIEDNGPGMDEPTRKRIFEPFFTTKPVGVGTGLGLSVSYFIITENHQGEMFVKSTPGLGAKFTIHLPMIREES